MNILIVGNPDPIHVGAHFFNAAGALGHDVILCDIRKAYEANLLWRKINWSLRGHRPAKLGQFGRDVVESCQEHRPELLLATGSAPISKDTLEAIGAMGICRANFLTDDPWNPAHRAPWFLDALQCYDTILSPRHANIPDLLLLGCREVEYLPFAYAPEIHYPQEPAPTERAQYESDVMFAGGADADRIPLMIALKNAGLRVALYGHDWDKHPELRDSFRGRADPEMLRKATASARICLCLVRRANRDGHAMRSYEVPAMGGVILAEDTKDHRDLFGSDGALFFDSVSQMVEQAKLLIANETEARLMAQSAFERVTGGRNTYRDRLQGILQRTPGR